jgi:hypothetical protein
MQPPQGTPPLPRRRSPVFRPSYTLLMAYVVGFFVLYALLLILPELLRVLSEVPPGPEQQRIAEEVAREAARPRIAYAVALSLASVGLGAYLKILPGLKK